MLTPVVRVARALLRQAARTPIESIVVVAIVATLAYFSLLVAISRSHWADTFAASASLRLPASAPPAVWSHSSAGWALADTPSASPTAVRPVIWIDAVGPQPKSSAPDVLPLAQSFAAKFPDIWSIASPLPLPGQAVWTPSFASPNTSEETHLLKQLAAASNDTFPSASMHLVPALDAAAWVRAGRSVSPSLAPPSVVEVDSVRLVAYASRALFSRFGHLIRSADSADIFVMLCVYIFMHATFVNLFLSMRRFRSNFWLGASVLISCTSAFLFALTSAHYLGVSIDPVALSEALPFLVVTVGFDKHYKLTKAVFTHPAFAPSSHLHDGPSVLLDVLKPASAGPGVAQGAPEDQPPSSSEDAFVRALTARLRENHNLEWEMPRPLAARDVLAGAYDTVSYEIIRDYVIELALLLAGACIAPSGLRQFCQLAALILFFDGILLHTFYTGILTVLVEVLRIRIMRNRRHPSVSEGSAGLSNTQSSLAGGLDATETSSAPGSDSPSTSGSITPTGKDNETANVNGNANGTPAISITTPTGIPVPSSSASVSGHRHRHHARSRSSGVRGVWHRLVGSGAKKNPVGRLKILLIASFITLHSLNLVGTLTTQASRARHLHASHAAASVSASGSASVSTLSGTADESSASGPYENLLAAAQLGAPLTPRSAAIAPIMDIFARSHPAGAQVAIYDPVLLVLYDSQATSYASRKYADLASAAAQAWEQAVPSALSPRPAVPTSSAHSVSEAVPADALRASSSRSLLSRRRQIDVLGSLMSQWTSVVGDPIISKWLSIGLVVSIFLNAYLLKGIAQGNAAIARGNAMGAAAFAAARMLGAHLDEAESRSRLASSANSSSVPSGPRLPNAATAASTVKQANGTGVAAPAPEAKSEHTVAVPAPAALGSDGSEIQIRGYDEVLEVYDNGAGVLSLVDEEVVLLGQKGKIPAYALEKVLQDAERAVRVRRALVSRASVTRTLETSKLPYENYNYAQVMGACCENVVGYLPLPLGIAGPLNIDGVVTPIPMATTEGTLVASTSRGCKALNAGGGVTTVLTQDAMTRGPVIDFPTAAEAALAKRWVDSAQGASTIKAAFDSTSRFARLASLRTALAGRTMFIRFATSTGDAMGMNMISKGVERALETMARDHFPSMKVLALSGNYCTDKKPAAINWIEGRGKSVVAEAVVPGKVVASVLKTSVGALVDLNTKKNLIGSAMAGSIGGFNAHAANILTAIYLATGQDPAQNVESSNCMTLMEQTETGDLRISVSMPSIEVGTVGGGTVLDPQRAMLDLLGIAGPHSTTPGANAQRLACIIAAAVMAGELSLMAALAAGHLIKAHMAHNRSQPQSTATTPGSVSPNPASGSKPAASNPGGLFAATMTPLIAKSVHMTPKT